MLTLNFGWSCGAALQNSSWNDMTLAQSRLDEFLERRKDSRERRNPPMMLGGFAGWNKD